MRRIIRAALRDEWDGIERITQDLRLADFATLVNAFVGIGAVLAALHGDVRLGIYLVFIGVLADGIDGAIARLGGGGGPLGPPLDSLADTVTFVVAPTILAAAWLDVPASWPEALWIVPVFFFAFCGLLRLARFEAMRNVPRRYFSGLSTPGAAVGLLGTVLLGHAAAVPIVAAAAGLLMVSRVRYPKLRGALGAFASLILLVVLIAYPHAAFPSAELVLGLMVVYLTAGPFYVLVRIGPTEVPDGA